MKKMKTSELSGAALDLAVARCERVTVLPRMRGGVPCTYKNGRLVLLAYSSDWSLGGPIIEREGINLNWSPGNKGSEWEATDAVDAAGIGYGPTPLIAAMRCYVAARLGGEVDEALDLAWLTDVVKTVNNG